jgi:6-phosphogluconolactonase (cycloisomerase 2 family)
MLKKLSATLMALCALAMVLTFANCGTSSSRPAGLILVTSQGDKTLLAYRADLTSGKLTQISTSVSTTDQPTVVVFDSGGAFAYVATNPATGNGKITAYSVASDGKLGAAGSSADAGVLPIAMALDNAGHLFVANQGSNSISAFSASGGSITKVPCAGMFCVGEDFEAGSAPSSITVEPSGKFLYVTNQGNDTVSAYSIESSGSLSELVLLGSPYPTATAPSSSAFATTATGSYLYITNSGSNNITGYVVCLSTIDPCTTADGSLRLIPSSPFGAGLNPVGIVVDPTNTFVYALDQTSNQVSGYRLNAATGGLSALNPATHSTGTRPVSIGMHPDGKFIYVVNSASNTISGYSLEPQNGSLTPITPLATSAQPYGLAVK